MELLLILLGNHVLTRSHLLVAVVYAHHLHAMAYALICCALTSTTTHLTEPSWQPPQVLLWDKTSMFELPAVVAGIEVKYGLLVM